MLNNFKKVHNQHDANDDGMMILMLNKLSAEGFGNITVSDRIRASLKMILNIMKTLATDSANPSADSLLSIASNPLVCSHVQTMKVKKSLLKEGK